MLYWALLALGCGIGVAIAAFGSALGLGRATAAALEGTARQPEAAGNIRTTLIIGGALIEALTIYALLMAILLMGKLPAVEVAEKVIGAMK
jgi:F-type H+-transporting ATPase subunit c